MVETVTERPTPISSPFHGGNDSWDDVSKAEAAPEVDPAPQAQDKRPGDPIICGTCSDEIIREPGARGRAPKYHPECRPSKTAGGGTRARTSRNDRASAEAKQCVAQFKSMMIKGCMLLSVVEKYDAFTVMVSLPSICDNLEAVLTTHDRFRKEWLAMQSGGSLFGLVLAVLMVAIPICAHHGLIPGTQITAVLTNLPYTLHKLNQTLKDGEKNLADLIQNQTEEWKAAKNAQRTANRQAANGQV